MSAAKHLLLLGLSLGLVAAAGADHAEAKMFKILHRFTGGADGASPMGDLLLRNGMLYGTTYGAQYTGTGSCSALGCGTVFQLDPTTGTLTTLYSFSGGADGANPQAGVTLDAAGMIYGTTTEGGKTPRACGPLGCGTAFELDPATHALTTLHAFAGRDDGNYPDAGLVLSNGKLYGATTDGGAHDGGTVFALDPTAQKLTTLYAFCALAQCADGAEPLGRLTFDSAGMIYGTTYRGGTGSGGGGTGGTIFELDPATGALATLHSFQRGLSSSPYAGLTFQNDNLFGVSPEQTRGLGSGSIFRFNLALQSFRTVYFFGSGANGRFPVSDLTAQPQAQSGLLYGTTMDGATLNDGTVFKFNAGPRTLTTLHAFSGPDGAHPGGGLALDTSGTLYGSTAGGGDTRGACGKSNYVGCGTVFELVP